MVCNRPIVTAVTRGWSLDRNHLKPKRKPNQDNKLLDFQGKGKGDENAIRVWNKQFDDCFPERLSNLPSSQSHNLTISHLITRRSHNLESMTYMQITPHHCHRIIIIVQKILLLVLLQEVLLPKWSDPPQGVIGNHWNTTGSRWIWIIIIQCI